jgi:cell division septation protein DedD
MAAAPARATVGRGWLVQLGAYTSEPAARTAWATLVAQSAALLEGQAPLYAPRGGLVRLQVGPFEDRGEAAALCQRLSASGRPCFVTGG